ncbi:DUF1249 domain-containing protein [Massilia sp. DJPM01]|uniref:DUF1249 domain-containing protein n=1 Tax=Massilia sp. DJPM01 TaxID=3024404 RepID=UPI00259FA7D9|nr:DUF1249 domain-containing protein [Massilia sp. DJPM01]MDM5182011.1 DUF1249 domain-containing protein [Massilia sp. DJPM01]
MNIYERNYKKLIQLIPTLLEIKTAAKLTAPGFMNLNVDILDRHHKKIVIALSHYYKHPSGDMIADPDMTMAVYTETESVEVLAYQDCFGYRKVYSEDGMTFSPSTKKELNSFLGQWLTNLLEQGHTLAK